MRRFPLVWLLSLALILSGLGSNLLGNKTMGSGPVLNAKAEDSHVHHTYAHVDEYAGHSVDAALSKVVMVDESHANCCRNDDFHCGGTQAVSSAAVVLRYFPLPESSLPALHASVYVGPSLARLIRPPIV